MLLCLGSLQHLDFSLSRIADSTRVRYEGAYRRWVTFCGENSLVEVPANPHDLTCCVAKVASETKSVSAAEALASSVAYEHRRRFLPSPTEHASFRMLMQSIIKKLESAPTSS